MKPNSFLDIKFLKSLEITDFLIHPRSIKLHPSSVRKPKPAIEEQKMQLAIKGRPAIASVIDLKTGEVLTKAIPSIQPRPAVLKVDASPAVPGGQVFYISTSTYDIMCEVVARFLYYKRVPSRDLRLGSEFLNQGLYHHYVIGYFISDTPQFRKEYAFIKKH